MNILEVAFFSIYYCLLMTYAQERMVFRSQRTHFPMRRAKKAVKYKVNPDA